jgi:hypothetical protein
LWHAPKPYSRRGALLYCVAKPVKFILERLDSAVRRVVERIIVTEGFDYKVKIRVSGGCASEQWDQAHENAKKEQRDE